MKSEMQGTEGGMSLKQDAASDIDSHLSEIRKLTQQKSQINREIGDHWHAIQRYALRQPDLGATLKSLYEAAACW
jgi:hypothetical protein